MKIYTIILAALFTAPITCLADNNSFGGYPQDKARFTDGTRISGVEAFENQCYECRHKIVYHPRGDRDNDGVPNYRDRHNDNGPAGDRDHDGIANQNDRHNNNRDYGDKDHDGIANIRDDHDDRLDTPKNR